MERKQAEAVVEEVFKLYEYYGNADYIGEPVSQIEHMCQAAMLARAEGYNEDVILAAFFHDIGHLCEHVMPTEQMNGFGVVDHETLGADYLLQKGFSANLVAMVKSHVNAKRYLTGKFPEYYDRLSPASRETLILQGGPMNTAELLQFESDPLHNLYIKLREWDDKAKLEEQPLPDLEQFKKMAIKHLLRE